MINTLSNSERNFLQILLLPDAEKPENAAAVVQAARLFLLENPHVEAELFDRSVARLGDATGSRITYTPIPLTGTLDEVVKAVNEHTQILKADARKRSLALAAVAAAITAAVAASGGGVAAIPAGVAFLRPALDAIFGGEDA
jgi:hypothetical protein